MDVFTAAFSKDSAQFLTGNNREVQNANSREILIKTRPEEIKSGAMQLTIAAGALATAFASLF